MSGHVHNIRANVLPLVVLDVPQHDYLLLVGEVKRIRAPHLLNKRHCSAQTLGARTWLKVPISETKTATGMLQNKIGQLLLD